MKIMVGTKNFRKGNPKTDSGTHMVHKGGFCVPGTVHVPTHSVPVPSPLDLWVLTPESCPSHSWFWHADVPRWRTKVGFCVPGTVPCLHPGHVSGHGSLPCLHPGHVSGHGSLPCLHSPILSFFPCFRPSLTIFGHFSRSRTFCFGKRDGRKKVPKLPNRWLIVHENRLREARKLIVRFLSLPHKNDVPNLLVKLPRSSGQRICMNSQKCIPGLTLRSTWLTPCRALCLGLPGTWACLCLINTWWISKLYYRDLTPFCLLR